MRILIVGCGAVGSYFGSALIGAGEDVTYLVRPRTAEIVRQRGLELQWPDRIARVPVAAITADGLPSWAARHRPDYVWLTVKCYDVATALRDIAPLMQAASPTIVTCQNGLGSEELVRERYPAAPVTGGIAYVYTQLLEPGVIRCRPGGSAAFGAWTSVAEDATRRWVESWQQAGLKVKLRQNIRDAKWDKLCWNAVFNALTAGMQCDVREVLTSPTLRQIGEEIVREVRAVAQAQGVALDEAVIATYFQDTVTEPGQYTSMYVDLRAGRPTEIDWINGAVVRLGEQAGIPTPVNRALRMLVNAQQRLRQAN